MKLLAAVAQQVERQLPKLKVAGSKPVCRSIKKTTFTNFILDFHLCMQK